MKTIYVEVEGGLVQAIYGDDVDVKFIVRDMDNIEAGDDDPLPEGYTPEASYY